MNEIGKYILVLTLISVVFGGLLALVYQVTKGPIEKSELADRIKAIKAVLPPFVNNPLAEAKTIKVKDEATGVEKEVTFYPAKDKSGRLIAVAVGNVSKIGYGGDIKLVVGIDIDGKIRDYRILSYAETPGLGTKATESPFKDQFKGRSLKNTKFKVKKDGGDIEAITGATITSRAITSVLAESLRLFQKEYGKGEDPAGISGATPKPKDIFKKKK
ncbi:MAG: RnfABCDGE type electron transport complex subunit G [Acidobacteria bacterium]|nr:RnfABCDGE type electron transport complex subunit G [Acidobacteriota bacterium]